MKTTTKLNLRKALLAGTAIVAVGAFATGAHATDVDLTADGTWSSAGTNTDDGTVAQAEADTNLNASADATLTITNDNTANDSGGVNSFSLGDVTDTAGSTLNIAITSGQAADLTVTLDSANIDGNFTVTGDAADDATIAVTFDDAAVATSIGGNLVLDNSLADAADTITLTANGDITVVGTTAVTAGTVANSGTAFVANKAATFTGLATFTGGGHADADATGLFQGATTFTGGATLDDATGQAELTFDAVTDGTGDIAVSGTIDGAAAGEGALIIANNDATTADTVTFSGAIGATNSLLAITVGVTGADGGHAVFNSTVAATTIAVGVADTDGDTATADFNGDVTVTNLNIVGGDTAGETASVTAAGNITGAVDLDDATGGDGTATITYDGTSAQTQTGAITTDDGEGTVVVSNTSGVTFTADLGSGAAGLDAFNVTGTATVQADVFTNQDAATDVGLDVDGTLNIDSSTVGVDILEDTGDIDFDGTVSITGNNATTITATSDLLIDGTFTTNLEGVALTLASTGDNVAIAGTSDTTLTVGNAITLNGDLAVSGNTGKSATIAINETATFDPDATTLITAAGDTVDIDSDGSLIVTIASTSLEFDGGETITVIDSDENVELDNVDTTYAALITSGDVVLQDTGLIDIQDNSSTAQDLLVTIAIKDATSVLESNGVAANAITGLTSASTTGNLQTLRQNLLNASNGDAAQDVLDASVSSVDAGGVTAALNVGNTTAGLNADRLASLRDGSATGVAAGNGAEGLKVWGQAFASTGDQDARDGIAGYDVDSYGFAIGADTENFADNMVVGLALSYADTEVDSKNASANKTDIDSYQISLYGDYDIDERTYLSGQLSYMWSDNDTTRNNVGGIAGVNASGDYDASQFGARAELGRDYQTDAGVTLTPSVLVNYAHYDADGYTETGAGTANLIVGGADLDIFEIGVGVDAAWKIENSDGSFLKPTVDAGVRHDLIGDEYATTNQFTGAGSAFNVTGFDPAKTTFDVGAGVTYFTNSGWDLTAEYDFEFKSDYNSHAGLVKASYNF